MVQALARADVEDAFRELGEHLVRAKKIAVCGGAAILLQFNVTFRTRDVDAVVEGGDHGAVAQAARDVARRRGWLESWLSEAVSSYVGTAGGTAFHGNYPSDTRVGLRVYVAKADYVLAMKLRAMRVGTRDEADALMLARASAMTSSDALLGLLRQYFPAEPPDARQRAIVGHLVERLDAALPGDVG